MLHTDEPRVGVNQAIEVVMNEAEHFLREMLQEGFFDTAEECEHRVRAVHAEICSTSRHHKIRATGEIGFAGGSYRQTTQELEFGLRRSWRNARKCIMRSQHDTLVLKDLRHIKSSIEMAHEVINGMREAYNNGAIRPTTFVFPPRSVGRRGPMIISQQLFAFACYKQADGTVLGDPANSQLTQDIIDLGWMAPEQKTRWDLLPFVTLAEDDAPAIVDLPPDLQKLVQIRHPRYAAEFEALDLKWVVAPALSRLGFDIGGVQYTATPFIGWFMDAEIGVRNLADTFRYNVLPDVVKALKLEASKPYEDLDDLPEYEKLALLSRAQAELNYATTWSYQQAGVSVVDSLTASTNFIEFDDAFKAKNGYRLPSDPYWLAPPQGSILPIWHRGGSPNYQPKPLIAKHVMDPVKAWRRELAEYIETGKQVPRTTIEKRSFPLPLRLRESVDDTSEARTTRADSMDAIAVTPSLIVDEALHNLQDLESALALDSESCYVAIHYCTAGITARKLTEKLHRQVAKLLPPVSKVVLKPSITSLDAIVVDQLCSNDLLLLVVSSTGDGDIPANGQAFFNSCKSRVKSGHMLNFKYAVFGNGDSRYADSYNGGAFKLWETLKAVGGTTIGRSGLFEADTAVEAVPTQALHMWLDTLRMPSISSPAANELTASHENKENITPRRTRRPIADPWTLMTQQLKILTSQYLPATVVQIRRGSDSVSQGSMIVKIDLGAAGCIGLGCIQVLPLNTSEKANATLRFLGLDGHEWLDLGTTGSLNGITNKRFFTELVDLELPFANLDWLKGIVADQSILMYSLSKLTTFEVVQHLQILDLFPDGISVALHRAIILSMRLLNPRTFSIASAAPLLEVDRSQMRRLNHIDIMVKIIPDGLFSDKFLSRCPLPSALLVHTIEAACTEKLELWNGEVPLIAIVTGAGFGPVRALLQRHTSSILAHKISVFVGVKTCDVSLISDVLHNASARGMVDLVELVPSNEQKLRVQDRLLDVAVREAMKTKIVDEGAMVFICTGQKHATEIIERLDVVVGGDVRELFGERLILEVY